MRKLKIFKRMLSLLLASAILISMTACNNNSSKDKNSSSVFNLSEGKKISNYYESKDLGIPDGIDYLSSIQSVNEKLYLYGMSVADMNMAEFYKLDTNSKSIEQFRLEKSTFPTAISYNGGNFYTTSFDEESGAVVYVHGADKKCKQTLKISDNSDTVVYGLSSDEKGNLFVLTLSSKGMTFISEMIEFDADGKETKRINLGDTLGKTTGGVSLYQLLQNDKEGNIYTARLDVNIMTGNISNTVIYKLNSALEKQYEISDLTEIGQLTNFFVSPNGNLMVTGTDESMKTCFVNEINSSGVTVNRYEIAGAMIAFNGTDESNIIYYTDEALFSYNLADKKSTELYNFMSDDAPQGFKNGTIAVVVDDGNVVLYTVPSDASMYNMLVMNTNGEIESTIPIVTSLNGNSNSVYVSADENIYYVEEVYDLNKDADSDDSQKCKLKLRIVDNQGNKINDFDIPDFTGNESTYVSNFVVDSENRSYFIVESDSFPDKYCLYIIDSEGKVLVSNTDKSIEDIDSLIVSNDGKVYAQYSSKDDKTEFAEVNPSDRKLGSAIELKGVNVNSLTNLYSGNGDYSIYINDGTTLYGYNFETGKSEEIINWLDSDFSQVFRNMAVVSKDSIACIGYNEKSMDSEDTVLLLNKADDEKLKQINEKSVITAAGCSVSSDAASRITAFNKSSDKSRIQVYDYAKYNTEDNESQGIKQLNNDIISGNIPDIILVNNSLNIDTYIKKGMITDLDAFLEKDDEIKKEDYLENIFDIGSRDGRLYQIIPGFSVSSLVGKKSIVGGESGWNMSEFLEFAEKNNGKDIFYNKTRDELLRMFIGAGMSEFVDYSALTCNFDNDDFIKILEFVKEKSSDETDDEKTNDQVQKEHIEYEKRFWNDKCLLDFVTVKGFTDFNILQKAYMKEEVSFKGMPSGEKSAASIEFSESFAISDKSKNKDAAWDFVRGYLLDDYQKTLIDGTIDSGFPVKLSVLDEMVANSQNSQTNIMQSYFVGDESIQIGVIDDDNVEKLKTLIKNIKADTNYDETIIDIIDEEAKEFFAGNTEASKVAANVQNRVKIYIDEQK